MGFTDVSFILTSASTYGGIFYVNSISGCISFNTTGSTKNTFSKFYASTQGSFLYSATSDFYLSISNSIVECKTTFNSQ